MVFSARFMSSVMVASANISAAFTNSWNLRRWKIFRNWRRSNNPYSIVFLSKNISSIKQRTLNILQTTMINYSIVMRSVNANLLEINQARVLAPSPAYPPTKNSTLNTKTLNTKKDESEHLENNSSDSHQHTDRYRYYARSNELHGIKKGNYECGSRTG